MSKLKIVKSQITPHYIDQLGCEGLWSDEIAQSLGTLESDVVHSFRYRIESIATEEQLNFLAVTLKLNTPGRPRVRYAFCTELAKMIVATYKSTAGFNYLRFLLKCERVVLEEVPKLLEKITILETQKQLLTLENNNLKHKEEIKRLRRIIRKQNKLLLAQQETLPRMDKPIIYKITPESALTEFEKRTAKIRHLKKVKNGIDNKLEEEDDELYN